MTYNDFLMAIHRKVAVQFNIGLHDLFKRSRKREIVTARHMFFYLCRKHCPEYIVSSTTIGRYYKDNYDDNAQRWDHASVLHSAKVIKNLIEYEKDLLNIERELSYQIVRILTENNTQYYGEEEKKSSCLQKRIEVRRYFGRLQVYSQEEKHNRKRVEPVDGYNV